MHQEISLSTDSTGSTTNQEFNAYVSVPENPSGKLPGLILIEEIWGVTEHIKNVADRFAHEGFNVIAPELLGGTGILENANPSIFAELRDTEHPEVQHAAQAKMREVMQPIGTPEFAAGAHAKLSASFAYLRELSNSSGSIGSLGFCFGGTWSFFLATKEPRLKACVAFYGQPPQAEDISAVSCPILAFYGEKDERLIESLPSLKDAMLKEGKDFSSKVYPNTGHAFFNDTNKLAYSEAAAQDAWKLSLEFLRENLG